LLENKRCYTGSSKARLENNIAKQKRVEKRRLTQRFSTRSFCCHSLQQFKT